MENTAITKAINACQTGDSQSFALIYDTYVDKIYAFVYYRTGHRETAEDLTSDIFSKVIEKIKLYNQSKGSFTAWLYTIARNTVYDHYRTDKPLSDIDAFWNLEGRDDIEHTAAIRNALEQVQAVLKTLSDEQQELLRLRLWDGLSHAEIAAVLGKSEAACKMAYSRAVQELREQLPQGALLLILIKLMLV